jgi:hypothetical protein
MSESTTNFGPEFDDASRITSLDKAVWQELALVGLSRQVIPEQVSGELPHGLTDTEVNLIESYVIVASEHTITGTGRRNERQAFKVGRDALMALGMSAIENQDFITSGKIIKSLDPGRKLWRREDRRRYSLLSQLQKMAAEDH